MNAFTDTRIIHAALVAAIQAEAKRIVDEQTALAQKAIACKLAESTARLATATVEKISVHLNSGPMPGVLHDKELVVRIKL